MNQFSHSTAELRRVKRMQFGVLSPEEIVRGRPPSPLPSTLLLAAPPPPTSPPLRALAALPFLPPPSPRPLF
jgi:hypothetical protein